MSKNISPQESCISPAALQVIYCVISVVCQHDLQEQRHSGESVRLMLVLSLVTWLTSAVSVKTSIPCALMLLYNSQGSTVNAAPADAKVTCNLHYSRYQAWVGLCVAVN